MRRKSWMTAALLALAAMLTLSACERRVEDKNMVLLLPEGRETGRFSGTLTDLVGSGTGTFTADSGWVYTGSFAEGAPVSGTVEGCALSVGLLGERCPGVYTGAVTGLTPEGEGSFTGDNGARFCGQFSGGEARGGQASSTPLTLSWTGERYTGLYTGDVAQGLCDGEGRFSGRSAGGLTLDYTGAWAQGRPAGDGYLTAEGVRCLWDGAERAGSYDGETRDGLPHGQGTFAGSNDEGVGFLYTGGFAAGLFDGQGRLEFDAENYYTRVGTFSEGLFTPTYIEALETFGSYAPRFRIGEEARALLEETPALWDASVGRDNYASSVYKALCQERLTPEGYLREPELYPAVWLRLYSLRVIETGTETYFDNGLTMTRFTAANNAGTAVFRCFLAGECPALRVGARVDMYAVPLGASQYLNTLGRQVSCGIAVVGDLRVR